MATSQRRSCSLWPESRDVRSLSEKILSIIIGGSSRRAYLGPREELEKMMGTT